MCYSFNVIQCFVKWIKFPLFADLVSCVHLTVPMDFLTVALGDSLTLNCTYNDSSGFVRGCWSKGSDNSRCLGTKSNLNTTSLHLTNVSADDLKNYTCYTYAADKPQLPRTTELIVLLQPQGNYIKINTRNIFIWEILPGATCKLILQSWSSD